MASRKKIKKHTEIPKTFVDLVKLFREPFPSY